MLNNQQKKHIIEFLLNNKMPIFILFVLPIINAVFNSYVISKSLASLIKYLMDINLIESKKILYKMICFILGLQILRYLQRIVLSKFLTKINNNVKKNTFEVFTSLKIEDSRFYPENVSKLADELVETINLIYSFLYRPFCALIITIITIMFMNKFLGKIFLVFSIVFFISLKYLIKKPMLYITNLEEKQASNKLFINDICRNFFLEKVLNLKIFTNNIFNNKLQEENFILLKKYDAIAINGLWGNLLCQVTCCLMLFVIVVSGIEVEMKISLINITFGFFFEFNDIPSQIIPLLNNIGKIKENIKIFFLEREEEKKEFNEVIENINMKNIDFAYNEVNIINNFSQELKKGVYVINGNSGSGKSTLLQLIMNLKKPNKGEIKINEKDIDNLNILNKVSYLSQFNYTYNRTVKENLSMNKGLIDIEKEIINYKMDKILNNQAGLNGENISGGQNRRLSFLRMLNFHKKGNLIILDEPFNGLDKDLIYLIINFVKENKDSIIIIIDHTGAYKSLDFIPIFFA